MSILETYEKVLVRWVDSHATTGDQGWVELDALLKPQAKKCYTVGLLIDQSDEAIIVAGSIGDDPPQVASLMTILKVTIESITRLAELECERRTFMQKPPSSDS